MLVVAWPFDGAESASVLVPRQDVEATHAAGPVARTYQFEEDGIPESLLAELLAGRRIGFAEIEIGGSRVTLRR